MCLLYFKNFFNTIPEIRKTAPAMRITYIKPVFPVPANPPVIVLTGVGVAVGPGVGVFVDPGPGVFVGPGVLVGVGVLVKVVVGVGVEEGVVPQFPTV
jgi:hypothetical protein